MYDNAATIKVNISSEQLLISISLNLKPFWSRLSVRVVCNQIFSRGEPSDQHPAWSQLTNPAPTRCSHQWCRDPNPATTAGPKWFRWRVQLPSNHNFQLFSF